MQTLIVLSALIAVSLAATLLTKQQLLQKFKADFLKMDVDPDDALNYKEFLNFYYHFADHGHLTEDRFMKITGDSKADADFKYKFYDANHDGDITEADVKATFIDFDTNGDGKVSFVEFEKYAFNMVAAKGQ